MTEEPSYYTPERINTILRNWPRYQSQAEGCRSTAPDALRPAKGRRGDQLSGADIRADIERAMVAVLPYHSLEWRVVVHIMQGASLARMQAPLGVRDAAISGAYDDACQRMAVFLGWEEEIDMTQAERM